jgi:hypothetical protein
VLGDAVALGRGVGAIVGVAVGAAVGVPPTPGGRIGNAGMPPFVLHAESAAHSAVAAKAAKNGFNMAQ